MPFISSSVTCNIRSSYIWSWGSTLGPEICLCWYSVAKTCVTTAAHQTSLSFTIFWSSLKLGSIELVMPFNHLILCCPLLPSIFPSISSVPHTPPTMSQFFTSGGQSIGASTSASVLPRNIQGWFPLGLTGWISLQSKEFSRVFSSTTI